MQVAKTKGFENALNITLGLHKILFTEPREEGIKLGEEKGKIEGKIEVAKAMLANNVDYCQVYWPFYS